MLLVLTPTDRQVSQERETARAGPADRFYPASETVPIEGVVPKAWRDAVLDERTGRVERIPYELRVLIASREALRWRDSPPRVTARSHGPRTLSLMSPI